MANPNPLWRTVTEAARESGVSTVYIRRLCNNGALNARIRGKTWLIEPSSFSAWLTRRSAKQVKK